MYSIENENAVVQVIKNAYIGTSMLAVMARQQNNIQTQSACVAANQKCLDVLQDRERSGELDFKGANRLLNDVSRLARNLWNIQMTPTGEKINVRIVNDIADAERHIETPESAEDIEQPADIEHFIAGLSESLKTTEDRSPYLAMLEKNDEAVTDEGLRAATQLFNWLKDIGALQNKNTVTKEVADPGEQVEPRRLCKVAKLPEKKFTLSSIQDLENWLARIDAAGGLPDTAILMDSLENCEKSSGGASVHASEMAELWAGQFKNLPQDWVEDAAKRLVHSACSTYLDTLSDTAVNRVKKAVSAFVIEPREAVILAENKAIGHTPDIAATLGNLDSQSIDDLVDRKERLTEELEHIEEAIESRSNARLSSSN